MLHAGTFHTTLKQNRFLLPLVSGIIILSLFFSNAVAQGCPPNIDFENGNFNNWTCYVGNTAAVNGANQINLSSSGPVPERHTMYSPAVSAMDPYGGFPVNCPNGSGYSVRLGNNTGGGEAEGISYEFTIPANQDEYSLIYHYAVVFQDPVHEIYQQPRMVVEITNVSDNSLISCASLTFVPFGNILPGFFESSSAGSDGTPVWCKDWSAVSVNLDGLAGKTIRLFFKTADCTFRRHFGYAYIDVNSECSSEFLGATYCADDTAVTVVAPYGYQTYTWYNSNFTQVIGNQQILGFNRPPAAGTTIAVQVVPYDGYGCPDTLYARLVDTLTVTARAGPDIPYCGENPVSLGYIPRPGLVYSWSPGTGLSDSTKSNPFASPAATTNYVLSVRNSGGGCLSRDTVMISSSVLDSELQLLGKDTYCLGTNDSAVLQVNPAQKIQWCLDGSPIAGAQDMRYKVTHSGLYSAKLHNEFGCIMETRRQSILIDKPRPGIRYPVEYVVANLPYRLEARSFGAVHWTPATSLDNPRSPAPMFTSSFDQHYTIRIETETGCVTVDTLQVKAVKRAEIYVPTAFTPNRDGKNDILRPVTMGIKELKYFKVFNRWGQLLFESRTQSAGWDGKINGNQQATGVVVWVAEGVGSDGQQYIRRGTTVLMQ
ncbi:MAG TPA: T9SS type B sorting domain-containing protein [Flavisolibacter sp.]|nr:T9SS type B sorting domain-containing protein [Flavisolibacter sp.]